MSRVRTYDTTMYLTCDMCVRVVYELDLLPIFLLYELSCARTSYIYTCCPRYSCKPFFLPNISCTPSTVRADSSSFTRRVHLEYRLHFVFRVLRASGYWRPKHCEYWEYEQYRARVQAVPAVSNPEILGVQTVSAAHEPEILTVHQVPALFFFSKMLYSQVLGASVDYCCRCKVV